MATGPEALLADASISAEAEALTDFVDAGTGVCAGKTARGKSPRFTWAWTFWTTGLDGAVDELQGEGGVALGRVDSPYETVT
jgi:hypothetical protein